MKLRPIVFALILSLLIVFSGCSSSKSTTTTTPTSSQPATQTQQDQKAQPQQQTETKATTSTQTTTPTQKATAPVATSTRSNQTEKTDVTVYVTKTGEKYHSAGCSSLAKSQISKSLSAAKSAGYTPCSKCNPPR